MDGQSSPSKTPHDGNDGGVPGSPSKGTRADGFAQARMTAVIAAIAQARITLPATSWGKTCRIAARPPQGVDLILDRHVQRPHLDARFLGSHGDHKVHAAYESPLVWRG